MNRLQITPSEKISPSKREPPLGTVSELLPSASPIYVLLLKLKYLGYVSSEMGPREGKSPRQVGETTK